jgi:hypothetical protein
LYIPERNPNVTASPTGYLAFYQADKQFPHRKRVRSVIRWDDDGVALVVDEQAGELVAARSLNGFQYLQATYEPVVAALPPDGWKLAYEQDGDEPDFVEDLLGWAVHADGTLTPLVASEGGYGEPVFPHVVSNNLHLIPPPATGKVILGAVVERIRKGKEPKAQEETTQAAGAPYRRLSRPHA